MLPRTSLLPNLIFHFMEPPNMASDAGDQSIFDSLSSVSWPSQTRFTLLPSQPLCWSSPSTWPHLLVVQLVSFAPGLFSTHIHSLDGFAIPVVWNTTSKPMNPKPPSLAQATCLGFRLINPIIYLTAPHLWLKALPNVAYPVRNSWFSSQTKSSPSLPYVI